MTKYFVIGTSYLVLQRKLLYFALSTSYFGESRSFGESRYGYGSFVKHLTPKAQRKTSAPLAIFHTSKVSHTYFDMKLSINMYKGEVGTKGRFPI